MKKDYNCKLNTNYIKPNENFKNEINKFNEFNKNKYSHSFMVRGHYRKLNSNWFKGEKGKIKWVFPYWKGKGIKIKKNYKI